MPLVQHRIAKEGQSASRCLLLHVTFGAHQGQFQRGYGTPNARSRHQSSNAPKGKATAPLAASHPTEAVHNCQRGGSMSPVQVKRRSSVVRKRTLYIIYDIYIYMYIYIYIYTRNLGPPEASHELNVEKATRQHGYDRFLKPTCMYSGGCNL